MAQRRLAHGAGGEEADRLALFELPQGRADAGHGHGALGGIIAGKGVNGDEVRAHCRYLVQYHVDHYLILRAVARNKIDEGDAVQRAKGMVADGDEGAGGKILQHVPAVDAQLDLELVYEQALDEFRARGVAAGAVDGVDLVDGQEFQQPVDELRMSVERRKQLADIIVVEHVGAYFVILFHIR